MIEYDIAIFGLTNMQKQILFSQIPSNLKILFFNEEDLTDTSMIEDLASKVYCAFINPRKLLPNQLKKIIDTHNYAIEHSHASILLFTEQFSKDQKQSIDTRKLRLVDLRTFRDDTLRNAIALIDKVNSLNWNNMAQIVDHPLDGNWYMLQIETTGNDPLEDDILSLTVSHMSEYKIKSTEILYIQPDHLTTEESESITRKEAVDYLNNLTAPIILRNGEYDSPFLKVLYHLCGQRFHLPFISIDRLAAITFSYLFPTDPYGLETVLASDLLRPYGPIQPIKHALSEHIDQVDLWQFYRTIVSVFENLEDRYNIKNVSDFSSLYYGSTDSENQ